MNKLKALGTLANAYRYVCDRDSLAAVVLEDKFHQLRRSIQDINEAFPVLLEEGYNGRMPAYF